MPDLDKVIQGLYCCVHNGDCYDCCPYHAVDTTGCKKQTMLADALAMLKAQEPVNPIKNEELFRCGNCKNIVVGYLQEFTKSRIKLENYCHNCGRPVKWE